MARRNHWQVDAHADTDRQPPSRDDLAPWLFPFDRNRHERARRLLGPDSAAAFTRPSTTAGMIDYSTTEFEGSCRADGHDPCSIAAASRETIRTLTLLADVEERHLVLIGDEPGHDALLLAELAVAHRRQLAQRAPAVHRPLLSLALVLLTHQLHAVGRFADAVATGQEAIDILTRLDDADDIDTRPALVLALDASLMTCLANDRRMDALEDLLRATDLLDEVTREHAEHTDDLHEHLRALSELLTDLGLDDDLRSVLHDVAPRWESALPEVGVSVPHATAPVETRARTVADGLYDEGVHLATSDGDGPAAAAAIGASVSAYRQLLTQQPAELWHLTLRRLSRALWRHALVINELLGRPRDAMGPGREALSRARQVLRAIESADEFDTLIGELGLILHDLAQIALDAGLVGEHDQLVTETERLDTSSVGARAMRALGTALHNRAAESCETTVALAVRDRPLAPTVTGGLAASTRAVAVRRDLLDPDDPMTHWEVANSLLAHGHLLCIDGRVQEGAQAMVDAYHLVLALPGRPAAAMREAAESALLAVCASHPGITPHSDWPL